MRIGYWARILYDHLSDSQIDRAFDIIESNGIGEALLKADGLSFDWHGEAMLRLLGHKALSKVMGTMKIPSRHRGKD